MNYDQVVNELYRQPNHEGARNKLVNVVANEIYAGNFNHLGQVNFYLPHIELYLFENPHMLARLAHYLDARIQVSYPDYVSVEFFSFKESVAKIFAKYESQKQEVIARFEHYQTQHLLGSLQPQQPAPILSDYNYPTSQISNASETDLTTNPVSNLNEVSYAVLPQKILSAEVKATRNVIFNDKFEPSIERQIKIRNSPAYVNLKRQLASCYIHADNKHQSGFQLSSTYWCIQAILNEESLTNETYQLFIRDFHITEIFIEKIRSAIKFRCNLSAMNRLEDEILSKEHKNKYGKRLRYMAGYHNEANIHLLFENNSWDSLRDLSGNKVDTEWLRGYLTRKIEQVVPKLKNEPDALKRFPILNNKALFKIENNKLYFIDHETRQVRAKLICALTPILSPSNTIATSSMTTQIANSAPPAEQEVKDAQSHPAVNNPASIERSAAQAYDYGALLQDFGFLSSPSFNAQQQSENKQDYTEYFGHHI